MPRVAILSPDPESPSGGMERFCQLLAGSLREVGWHTDLVGPGDPPNPWIDRLGGGTFSRSRAAITAAEALGPDLIVGNNHLGWGGQSSIPRIQVFHGTIAGLTRSAGQDHPLQEQLRRRVFAARCEARAARNAHVVAVSHGTAAEINQFYGTRADAVIGNGVDTDTFVASNREAARAAYGFGEPTALFVGRAEWGKGVDVLVAGARAAGMAVAHAGTKTLPGARSLGVLRPEQLVQALNAADCLLAPTRYEGCSYAILEALACGTPVVTTRVGWIDDLLAAVPTYAPLIIEPTVASIAAGLQRLQTEDHGPAVAAATAHVRTHQSLTAFATAWQDTCHAVLGSRS